MFKSFILSFLIISTLFSKQDSEALIKIDEFINTETWEIDNNMNLWQE